jgi:putative CocE/NonD family hydrolase
VIGPWSHTSRDLFARSVREGVAWFHAQVNGGRPGPPVDLYIGGADEWRSYDEWPPPARTREWFLGPDHGLTTTSSPAATPDHLRYDPADPTPSLGGPLLTPKGGRRDNAQVEARDDVLVYSSDPLTADIEAVGPVTATIRVRSSTPDFDVYVRICDVDPAGRSENICDGLTRVSATTHEPDRDGVRAIEVPLWPTAYRWRVGHRIRMQLAGGAHPRYARNTGSGEPLATAATLRAVDHEVMIDSAHPSLIRLPIAT